MCENKSCLDDACKIPYGFCHCGCGGAVSISPRNRIQRGTIKGEFVLYIYGHRTKINNPEPPNKNNGYCHCGCGDKTPLASQTNKKRGWVEGLPVRYVVGHAGRKSILYIIDEITGCWNWQLHKNDRGYGDKWCNNTQIKAHRYMYELHKGPIPEGLQLDHLCKNPSCVNPDHLEPVTAAENTRRSNSAKLTIEDIRDIREKYASGNYLQRELGDLYDVTVSHISNIVNNRVWKEESV